MALNLGFGASAAAEIPVQPPQNIQFIYYDEGGGLSYSIDVTWDAPLTGPTPDSYTYFFQAVSSESAQTNGFLAQFYGIPSGQNWTFEIYSTFAGFNSVPVIIYENAP